MKIKMSFIMIVLNGMPFIEAALKSIYKAAYEIIIIEGAEEQCWWAANSDGSSNDGTVEFIKSFPDLKKKIKFIQGKWDYKLQMQNEALKIATGNYVWLVDSDEVYKELDIKIIMQILWEDRGIYQINLPIIHFWKGFDYIISSEEKPRNEICRIFRRIPPCYFTTHRPPTLFLEKFNKETNKCKKIGRKTLEKIGIFCYHYSHILQKQVKQKTALYKIYGWELPWRIDLEDWFWNCFIKWTPGNKETIESQYRILPVDRKSKTKQFLGTHPKFMEDIIRDFRKKELKNV